VELELEALEMLGEEDGLTGGGYCGLLTCIYGGTIILN
jgi:hypothetical protein